jgi:hypothetical protein
MSLCIKPSYNQPNAPDGAGDWGRYSQVIAMMSYYDGFEGGIKKEKSNADGSRKNFEICR